MKPLNIHASCVRIGASGILLLGRSGSGKSDLALRLIADGAKLVADDRTELFVAGGRLRARPPRALAGLMEINGLGIIAQPHVAQALIALAVQLDAKPQRLPKAQFYTVPLQDHAPVPLIGLDAFQASAPARIAAALTAFSKGLFRDTANPK
jgi:serine kinase of HPr protein (carbohydrate metabolism regulator)